MRIKTIYAALFLAVTCIGAAAQNLDPTVEVSRAYEGKLMEVHKPALDMAVPDTVQRFDLDFDYSVFERPYKGSYEFNPYMTSMRPASSGSRTHTFYLDVGAGYTFHPLLDAVWSPDLKNDALALDVYASHKSYIGGYRALAGHGAWSGYDMLSKAGADLSYDWNKASMKVSAGYYGVALKDCFKDRMYDALDLDFSLKSKALWPKYFLYDIHAAYRFAEDKSSYEAGGYLGEHDFVFNVSIGPAISEHKILLDVDLEYDVYSGARDASVGELALVPHYVYEKDRLNMDIGLRISTVLREDGPQMDIFPTSEQAIFPDITVDYALIPDALRAYAVLGGGNRLNTYASLIDSNHHIDMYYGRGIGPLMDITVERISACAGLEGRVSSVFGYDLRGGYVNYGNAPLDAVYEIDGVVMPSLWYSEYQKLFAVLDWNLDMERLRFDGTLEFNHAWGYDHVMVAPAMFTGDVAATYNWNRRIFAGVDCNWAAARSNDIYTVPGYADLGIYAEYGFSRKMSFWLRGGNLLNMNIQRNVMFAEKGVNFTAGIRLNL